MSSSINQTSVNIQPFSVKVTKQNKSRGNVEGKIFEGDVLIATFKRKANEGNWIQELESKFLSEAARRRFDNYADSISVNELIECLGGFY